MQSTAHRKNSLHGWTNGNSGLRNSYLQTTREFKCHRKENECQQWWKKYKLWIRTKLNRHVPCKKYWNNGLMKKPVCTGYFFPSERPKKSHLCRSPLSSWLDCKCGIYISKSDSYCWVQCLLVCSGLVRLSWKHCSKFYALLLVKIEI